MVHVPAIQLKKAMFKRGLFDFVTCVEKDGVVMRHEKQELALRCLTSGKYREVAYGGAAGGAKSWTGCVWLAFSCMLYPGTRWFIAREELKRLRESTLQTWYKVCSQYNITEWNYNGQDHFIKFENGSRIDLLELKELPSDPLFERYGSVEYTGGWIEEAGEVCGMGYDTIKSRCGRQLNDKYGIPAVVFVTFNPKKNFVYQYFYRRDKDGTLPPHITFIKALLYDNPHREAGYEQQLLDMSSKAQKARLLDGNFEYDDDPSVLCDYDAISDIFTNAHVLPDGRKRGCADLAMKGRDRFVAGHSDGLVLYVDVVKGTCTAPEIEADVKHIMNTHNIGRSQFVADSDGLGAFLGGYIKGIVEFHGGATAVREGYGNLKDDCAYMLAEKINKRELYVICTKDQQEQIKEELGQLREGDVDADTKKRSIVKKDEMKKNLGRSPDFLDWLIMSMYHHVKPPVRTHVQRDTSRVHGGQIPGHYNNIR